MFKNITILLFCLLGFLTTAQTAFAITGGSIGAEPANPDPGNPRSSSIFIFEASPGQILTDKVRLINNENSKVDLKLYSTDHALSNDGSFTCEQYSQADDNAGAWIRFEDEIITLEANSTQEVAFTIEIPQNAEIGEYNACVALENAKKNDSNTGINLSTRLGIRVVINIKGGYEKKLAIVDYKLIEEGNKLYLQPVIMNSGNVSIDANIKIKTRLFGLIDYSTNTGSYPILRDQTSTLKFDFPRPLFGGWYISDLTLHYSNDPSTVLGVDSSLIETLKAQTTFLLWPHWIILIGIIVSILIIIYMIFKKKSKKKVEVRNEQTTSDGLLDTVDEIRKKMHS